MLGGAREMKKRGKGEGMGNGSPGWPCKVQHLQSLPPMRKLERAHAWPPACLDRCGWGPRGVRRNRSPRRICKEGLFLGLWSVPLCLSSVSSVMTSWRTWSFSSHPWALLHPPLPGRAGSEGDRYHPLPSQLPGCHHFLVTLPCLLDNVHILCFNPPGPMKGSDS